MRLYSIESRTKANRAMSFDYRPVCRCITSVFFGWGTRIRTSEWWNQNPLPYRLAIPQKCGGYDGNRTCDPSIMSAVL